MIKKLFNISRADMLLVAATVVAALRMMLINSQAIGFNVKGWWWFAPAEVVSGIAFAILEGVALAYVSKRWRRFQPVGWTGWGYWVILLAGQLLLLVAIVWVTGVAFVATRRNLSIDEVLQPGAALAWSMLVAAINPLIVILIGIVEDDKQADRPPWPPLDAQVDLFIRELGDQAITPDEAARRFAVLTNQSVTTRIFAQALAARDLKRLSARVDDVQAGESGQGDVQQAQANKALATRSGQGQADEQALDRVTRRERVREMHAQGGMSQEEIARVLGCNVSTVRRDLAVVAGEGKIVQGNGKVRA